MKTFFLTGLLSLAMVFVVLTGCNLDALTQFNLPNPNISYSPKTRDELQQIVDSEIARQGNSANLNNIDTSAITDMSGIFDGKANFNGDISSWNVSNVNNMNSMFKGAAAFTGNLDSWQVESSAVDLQDIFTSSGISKENGNLPSWYTQPSNPVVSEVQISSSIAKVSGEMSKAFPALSITKSPAEATGTFTISPQLPSGLSLDQANRITGTPTAGHFRTTHTISFNGTGHYTGKSASATVEIIVYKYVPTTRLELIDAVNAEITEQGDSANLNIIKTSLVNSLQDVFKDKTNFNGDISEWDVSNVSNMQRTFSNAAAFNQDISAWNVSNVTDMSSMFFGAKAFNQDISSWDVSNVTRMASVFQTASAFNQNINSWNVANVTSFNSMFSGARSFNQPLNNWNVSKATDLGDMFVIAQVFNQDISSWDVSNVINMTSMFLGTSAFNQNISGWNVSKVTSYANFKLASLLSTANTPSFL